MEPFSLEFVFSEKVLRRTVFENMKNQGRTWWAAFPFCLGVVLTGASMGYMVVEGQSSMQVAAPLISGLIFMSLPFGARKHLKKVIRESPYINKICRWEFTDKNVTSQTEGSTTSHDWASILEAREIDGGFLLFFCPKIGSLIPSEAFASDREKELLRAALQEHGIKLTQVKSRRTFSNFLIGLK